MHVINQIEYMIRILLIFAVFKVTARTDNGFNTLPG